MVPSPSDPRITEALRTYWGFDTLRPLQAEAIRAGIDQRDSLVVLPTGGGKSLCYQVPPLVTGKLTIVISPLIALMKDQVDGLRLANYPAAAMHSGMDADELSQVRRDLLSGKLKLLLVAPERLLSEGGNLISLLLKAKVGSFAIDEAHCISQWGHDFRPEYRRLAELREHFPGIPLHAYTATATPRVREDIIHQLDLRDPAVLVGCFDRPNLTYRILPRVSLDDQIEEALRRHEGRAAIVYCMSRKETERIAAELTERGIQAKNYHAGMTPIQRHKVQDAFANEQLNVVVATVAFGMGIDRSDVRCVVHAGMPKTIEHYQQETGRAGRDGLPSECVLFYSAADVLKWKQLMDKSAAEAEVPPTPETIAAQHELLEHMQRLCAGVRCRHRALSEYFGQDYTPTDGNGADGCGACDVCLKELAPVEDAQTIAKKIISCIARLRMHDDQTGARAAGYGAAYLAEVLRGAATANVIRRGHEHVSTFGILRTLDKDRIVSYINQLVDLNAVGRTIGDYPVLVTTTGSMQIIKDARTVSLYDPVALTAPTARSRQTPEADSGEVPLSSDERRLFDALRELRRAVAADLGVPPYLVFSDVTLEEISRVRPASEETFSSIRGVGAAKLRDFGERFVKFIASYCREHKLMTDAAQGSRPRPKLAAKVASAAKTSPVGTKATAFKMYARGATVEDAAAETGRAISTCWEYLSDWIAETKPASIAPWVDDRTYSLVADTAARIESPKFKAIFDHLGGSVGYEQIRIVMAHKGWWSRAPR